jgi:hypothetical protein
MGLSREAEREEKREAGEILLLQFNAFVSEF